MIYLILPLLLTPIFLTVLTKGAAFIFHRTKLMWLHALLFSLLLLAVNGTGSVVNHLAGMPLPTGLSAFLGLVVALLVGGFYLGPRAKTSDGVALQFKGGVLLALLTYGLLLVIAVIMAVFLPMLHSAASA